MEIAEAPCSLTTLGLASRYGFVGFIGFIGFRDITSNAGVGFWVFGLGI